MAEACCGLARRWLISAMEHHSNIIPWQLLRDDRGIELRVAPISDAGELDLDAFAALLADGKGRPGVDDPYVERAGHRDAAERIVQIAHAHGAKVLFDGAQAGGASAHRRANALDCDFYAWTGHKLYGPTGIGVLWGRRELLDRMPPFWAGRMISSVTDEKSTWAEVPHKFEAGTPRSWKASG